MTWFHTALVGLPEPDRASRDTVRQRAEQVLRPSGALQRFDDIAIHIAGWQQSATPTIADPAVLVFAGDHGAATAGVSAYPTDITAAMLAATRQGVATINVLAAEVGATVDVFDVGVGDPTGDIRFNDAMSPDRFEAVAAIGVNAVDAALDRGADLLVLGELGIGNTTVAAALTASLLDGRSDGPDRVNRWVGRGTGVDDAGLARKQAAVAAAVERIGAGRDPIEVLRRVGGTELAAMAAGCLRARQHRVPVILDGYVATAAALALHTARPGALDHCLAGHVSAEPGHGLLLEHLGLAPLLELGLRLGEGSGGVAAVPLVQMACRAVVEVPTFAEWFDP